MPPPFQGGATAGVALASGNKVGVQLQARGELLTLWLYALAAPSSPVADRIELPEYLRP